MLKTLQHAGTTIVPTVTEAAPLVDDPTLSLDQRARRSRARILEAMRGAKRATHTRAGWRRGVAPLRTHSRPPLPISALLMIPAPERRFLPARDASLAHRAPTHVVSDRERRGPRKSS